MEMMPRRISVVASPSMVAERFSNETLALPIVPHRLEGIRSRLGFAEAAQMKLLSLAPDIIHDMGAGWYCDVFHPHGGSWASVTERKQNMLPSWLRGVKRRVDSKRPDMQTLGGRAILDRSDNLAFPLPHNPLGVWA